MSIVNFIYNFFDGPSLAFDFSGLWSDIDRTCDAIAKRLRVTQRAVPQAREAIPHPEDKRPTAIELDIRSQFARAIEKIRRRANKRLHRFSAKLNAMAIDVGEAETKRIKAGLAARLAEVLTAIASRLHGLAKTKVQTESALAGFRAMNAIHDVPTARSALEWFVATLAAALVEALVNAHLFKGEMGYVDAVGFAMGVGGAIALIGIAGGIGWAQFRRPLLGRRIGGIALFATALGVVGFFILGIAHYREALGVGAGDAASIAKATMTASPLAPLGNTKLLPYVILNLAGFALVCWKSIAMWGFLDLKRLERANAVATGRFEAAKENGRGDIGGARRQAFDLLDQTLKQAETNVEDANVVRGEAQDLRDTFKIDATTLADAAMTSEQEYREVVEMVHPMRDKLARFNSPIERLAVTELTAEQGETAAIAALAARLIKIREAVPIMTDELGAMADEAIAAIARLAIEAEEAARINPRGRSDNVLRFGK